MSLVELFNDLQKTAGQASNRQPDDWDRAAASHGMTTDQYLDKVAEAHVQEQVVMTKSAQASHRLGEYMAAGFWDAMSKVANSHPVRDGVPEIYIKIAQASKVGLTQSLIKAAVGGAEAAGLLQRLLSGAKGGLQAAGGHMADAGRAAYGATAGRAIRGGRSLASGEQSMNRGLVDIFKKQKGGQALSDAEKSMYEGFHAGEGGPIADALMRAGRISGLKDIGIGAGLPALGIGAAGTGAAALGGAFD